MTDQDFDDRLRGYLDRGASTPPPAGLQGRILDRPRRRGWLASLPQAPVFAASVIGGVAVLAVVALAVNNYGLLAERNTIPAGGRTPTPGSVATPTTSPAPPQNLLSVSPLIGRLKMLSTQVGWAEADSKPDRGDPTTSRELYRTTDGMEWKGAGAGDLRRDLRGPIEFGDETHAWAVALDFPDGLAGGFLRVVRTSDGGKSWRSSGQFQVAGYPSGLQFVDNQHGWLSVDEGVSAGRATMSVFRTTDGGDTWEQVTRDSQPVSAPPFPPPDGSPRCGLNPAAFKDENTGWMTGMCVTTSHGYLRVTHDGGRSWTMQELPLPPGNCWRGSPGCGTTPSSVGALGTTAPAFSDSSHGYFVVMAFCCDRHVELYRTSDGGNTWVPSVKQPFEVFPEDPIQFIHGQQGWKLVGDPNDFDRTVAIGHLYASAGPDEDWTEVNSDEPIYNGAFCFINPTDGFAIEGGYQPDGRLSELRLARTHDGGATWSSDPIVLSPPPSFAPR
ncbi:MAG: hypothetical protein QOE92_2626 [Chloroflexota bacterium]|jgi:hypothetical protein|nr:hypothetical protein [Chloroflexota bacterium]